MTDNKSSFGSECQRLSIAHILLKDAPVILLDEATTSLITSEKRIRVNEYLNDMRLFRVYVETPKTATSAHPLPISTAAIMMLLEYQAWQDTQLELLGDAWENQEGRVFTTDTGAPMFPDSLTQWFNSGMPKVTVHSLRHTYASLMIADNVPLIVVSRQLRHSQASTTANIYAHAIASARAKTMQTFDRFNDLVGQNRPKNSPLGHKKSGRELTS